MRILALPDERNVHTDSTEYTDCHLPHSHV